MKICLKITSILWWQWLVGIYLFLTLVTIIFPHFPQPQLKWYIMYNFTLSAEMNLAVWFSGISLLILALLTYEIFSAQAIEAKMAWLVLSLIFFGFFVDEIGSLHERIINEWGDLLPYLLGGGTFWGYSLISLFYKKDTRQTAVFLIAGFALFGLVAVQEIIEHNVVWPDWAMGMRVGLEEGTELAGIFLCFLGVIRQRQRHMHADSFKLLIPNPFRMTRLPLLLGGGTLLHFLSLRSIVTLTDIGLRGNPAAVYPIGIFFTLAVVSLWAYFRSENKTKIWLLLSAYLTTCSVGVIYLSHLLLGLVVWFPGALLLILPAAFLRRYWIPPTERHKYLLFVAGLILLFMAGTAYHSQLRFNKAELFLLLANFYFLSQLVFLTSFYVNIGDNLPNRYTAVATLLALSWLVGFVTDMPVIQFLALGVFACFVARLFWTQASQSSPTAVSH